MSENQDSPKQVEGRDSRRIVWLVELFHNDKSEGWWTGCAKGEGGWRTENAWAAKQYSEAEAKAVATALDYFPTPNRWSHWVATEHIFMGVDTYLRPVEQGDDAALARASHSQGEVPALREAIAKIEKLGNQLQNPKHPEFDPVCGQRIMGCAILVREAIAAAAAQILEQHLGEAYERARLIQALKALRAWEHWYNIDSTEFNRDSAREEGLKVLDGTETVCAARHSDTGANDPQDCDWPVCGCDPHADKVIEALQESGKLADAGELSRLREALEAVQKEFDSAARNTNRGYRYGEAVMFSSQTKEQVRAALASPSAPGAMAGKSETEG